MSSNKSSTIHQEALSAVVVGTALGGGDGSSLLDKLRELQTARDEEILTESEFQALRQNAIASLMTNGSSDVAPFVSQQPTTGPAAAAEQSAPVVPIPMERGQNGPCESREAARATIRADKYSISAFSLNGIWCGLCCLVFPWCGTLHAVDEDTYVRHLQCLVWPLLLPPPPYYKGGCCVPPQCLCGREYRRIPGTNRFLGAVDDCCCCEDWEEFNNCVGCPCSACCTRRPYCGCKQIVFCFFYVRVCCF